MFLDHQDNNTYDAILEAGADTILIHIGREAEGMGELANAVLSKLILRLYYLYRPFLAVEVVIWCGHCYSF